jgi:hypothetical protein
MAPDTEHSMALQEPLARFVESPDKKNRFLYQFNGTTIYEWEQTLEECIIYIPAPPAPVQVTIEPTLLTVGLKSDTVPPFLQEPLFDKVETNESTWTKEDGMIVIYLQKAAKGKVWKTLLLGRPVVNKSGAETSTYCELNPLQHEQVQQVLLLERWQEEHRGMDFRDATFNGSVPDPRTYMGGISYR